MLLTDVKFPKTFVKFFTSIEFIRNNRNKRNKTNKELLIIIYQVQYNFFPVDLYSFIKAIL